MAASMGLRIIAILIAAVIALTGVIIHAYAYPQKGPAIAGVVTKIVDGDTIDAKLANNETVRIRFTMANTPERSTMPGWKAATEFTKERCPVGSTIIMDPDAGQRLSFYRNVAKVFCLSQILQNSELVESGLAVINHSRWCPLTEFKAEAWTGCPQSR